MPSVAALQRKSNFKFDIIASQLGPVVQRLGRESYKFEIMVRLHSGPQKWRIRRVSNGVRRVAIRDLRREVCFIGTQKLSN